MSIDATRNPIVHLTITNEAMADSRDVAAYFGKEHRRVLQTIREIQCSEDFRRHNFVPLKIKDLTGESTSHVTMTKDGFTFLAMGFTGGRAAAFKERYIAAFNVMEAELRKRTPSGPTFIVPQTLSEALRLAADLSDIVEQQKLEIATLAPKGSFYDQFVDANGLYGYQNAGRALGCRPNKFADWLKRKYIFYSGDSLVPYQQYLQAGLFQVRNFIGDDGKARPRGFLTAKGLEYFSSRIPSEIKTREPVIAATELV